MPEEYDDQENIEEQEGGEEEYGQQSDFSVFFQEHLYALPWWALSLVIHVIILCLSFLIVTDEPQPVYTKIEVNTTLEQEKTEEFKPEKEKKRDVFKQVKEVNPEEPTVEDPVVKDAKTSDHNETANEEDSKMSKGNKDASSDSPFEGKFDNSEIGVGGGAGGMFGDRFGGREDLVKRGGSKQTESAVQAGLLWLKRHQSPDGKWDADGFTQQCGRESKFSGTCDGTGHPTTDIGVTGLALLCFLGAGNTTTIGEFKEQVKLSAQYLKNVQNEDGCFGPKDGHYMYNHAIATLAMAEAYIQSNYNPLLKSSAQKGVDYLVKAQNPNMGWRYTYRCNDNDTSVTGWCVMALKSAKVGGLDVPDTAFSGAKSFLDSVTSDDGYYHVGYTKKGSGNFVVIPECMTAVAMTARVFMGAERNDPYLLGGAGSLKTRLPAWGEDVHGKSSTDYYYWYYGTLAMYQMGQDFWTSWNDKMKSVLVDHQEKEGCLNGSWPCSDEWSKSGGRIYTTSINVLSLEIYYRYAKVFK